jgi:DNA (cytosine-5)-methyltransferase 1
MVPITHRSGAWKLSELSDVPKNNFKVFSCFHCGGGSTMGYKLSGYEVLGGVEIDPKMMAIYKANHNPKLPFLMGVEEFNKIPKEELPEELFNLDILDGSPPCSSFSMAGSREKAWGKKKKFREGQADQVLDDLFFHYIETAKKLQPKVVIAENVKGLVAGKARGYVKMINQMFGMAGYRMQLFLLNSAFMGVPQRRERTFFVGLRKDIKLPGINLSFNETPISSEDAIKDVTTKGTPIGLSSENYKYWNKSKHGDNFSKQHPEGKCYGSSRTDPKKPMQTVTSQIRGHQFHWDEPRNFSREEVLRFQSFPDDYNFGKNDPGYICGMSVPPYMMNRISKQIELQWLTQLS